MNNNNICIYTKLIFYIRTVWVFLEHLFKFSTKQAKNLNRDVQHRVYYEGS